MRIVYLYIFKETSSRVYSLGTTKREDSPQQSPWIGWFQLTIEICKTQTENTNTTVE